MKINCRIGSLETSVCESVVLLGCVTEGDTFSKTIDMAGDALGIYLYSLKKDEETYSEPSNPTDIKAEGRDFVVLIEYDEMAYVRMK